jgi:hypothetical protein
VVGVLDTILDGKELKLITFQTAEFEGECFHTGRFNCASVGVAEFVKNSGEWQLVRFSPALSCMGAFGMANPVRVIRLGKNNYGYILEDINGGAGGPFYSRMELFAESQGAMMIMMGDVARTLVYTDSCYYNASYSCAATDEEKSFGEFKIVSKGIYNTNTDDEGWDPPYFESQLINAAKGKTSFKMTYTTTYRFDGTSYLQKSEEYKAE